jgi:peptide-methionine (S)-S-oxide reductase
MQTEAIFGAGCFWHVEHAFRQVPGVLDVTCGYSGGIVENPTYQQVCTGATKHAEVVRVVFDPQQVSYNALLEAFWACHDPTQMNRQGPDIGTQYRSVIMTTSDSQAQAASAAKAALEASGQYARPIATVIEPAHPFYTAEDYHQRYFEKHGIACGI